MGELGQFLENPNLPISIFPIAQIIGLQHSEVGRLALFTSSLLSETGKGKASFDLFYIHEKSQPVQLVCFHFHLT